MAEGVLDERLVAMDLGATTRKGALRELAVLVAETGLVDSNEPSGIADEVVRREHLKSSISGNGISLQHAAIDSVTSCRVVLGRSITGIDIGTVDDRPVHVILLILTNPERRAPYLNVLSRLVPMFHATGLSERLVGAPGPHELIEAIMDCTSNADDQ